MLHSRLLGAQPHSRMQCPQKSEQHHAAGSHAAPGVDGPSVLREEQNIAAQQLVRLRALCAEAAVTVRIMPCRSSSSCVQSRTASPLWASQAWLKARMACPTAGLHGKRCCTPEGHGDPTAGRALLP